jgi:tRNA nucleotidyltransferase/poly(A) polymerase
MAVLSERFGLSFVPEDVLKAMESIQRAGFEVWIVGGALRDLLLATEPKDWDLATSASTAKIISIFPKVIPVGIRHGTVQVHTRIRDIEITSYEPPGEVGLLKDLGRRDFTINSLALSYPDGILIDAHGGREDLRAGLLRAVGNPVERFSEDPLRIVRAARICGTYGFTVDKATFDAMRHESGKLDGVSGERIRDEILKILSAENIVRAFDLLERSDALGRLLPGLDAAANIETREGSGVSVLEQTLACIVNCPGRTRVRLAALLHNMATAVTGAETGGQPADFRIESARIAARSMKKWNMSKRYMDEVSTLVRRRLLPEAVSWSDAEIRRFITAAGPELLDDFAALAEAEVLSGECVEVGIEDMRRLGVRLKTQLGRISAFSVRELALGGDEVMRISGCSPGPEVGEILNQLFDLVQAEPALNTRDNLARIVETRYGAADR